MASMQIMINQMAMAESGYGESFQGISNILRGKSARKKRIGSKKARTGAKRSGRVIIEIDQQLSRNRGSRPYSLCG